MTAKLHGLRVAAGKVLADIVTAGYEGVRADAEKVFGAARRELGAKTLDVALPDGTSLGTISILAGPAERTVNMSAVAAIVAQQSGAVEALRPEAVTDPALLAFVRDHMPHLIETKVRQEDLKAALKRIDAEGCLNGTDGKKVKVAEVQRGEPTGEFRYRPSPEAEAAIRRAWQAGELQELLADLIRPAVEAGGQS
ncbi:hypothetical protein Ssi03_51040 [Sphaerisporangium siamense]|uniref:Uncharacterized protein n=1 Tax=Sphaerisporangium siamense TaxID=795645 RepID=A0A7W7D8J1_9ACTN|nr:hypothetical protein [Sphaerisporangium siamense]MBB4702192.1 hypothetical protein [Sphaerisporangium siamense]GII87114.1 hypothetical protein Ssi03_51040 [Sphaerisporangium siamense]